MTEADQERKAQTYAADFYRDRRENTLHSARSILGILNRVADIRSVVDFGCGSATWLSVARDLGAGRVLGIEGSWVDAAHLDIPSEDMLTWELEQPVSVNERFDLAISLEVAEHLSASRAMSFVDDICRSANLVLFSAAVPGQGGELHINEQWQSYWAEKFARNDYRPLDIVRPAIWNDDRIPYWYRQNTLVYATGDAYTKISGSLPQDLFGDGVRLDIVHPDLYLQYAPYNVWRALHGVAKIPGHLARKVRQ